MFVNETTRQLVKLKGYEQTGVHFHSLLAGEAAFESSLVSVKSTTFCSRVVMGCVASETVRGGTIERFREFVVFDGKYAYPEFLLAYKRTSVRSPDGLEPEPE